MAVPVSSNVTSPEPSRNTQRRSNRTRKSVAAGAAGRMAISFSPMSLTSLADEEMDVDADEESDHDAREDVPTPAESSEDEFEEVAPKKRPRKSAMKGAGAKRKKNVQIRKEDETENFLYETLTEATVDLPTAVQEWLSMYVDSRREALQALVNCLIKVCLVAIVRRVTYSYLRLLAANTQLHQIRQ